MIVAAVCCCRKIKKGRSQDRNRPLTCVRSSRLGLTWANEGWPTCRPQVKRAPPTRSGGCRSVSLAGGTCRRPGGLAVPAGVGLGDGEAEFLELGDQLPEPAVVVEPGAVVGELVVGQDAGGGPAVFLAGPLVVVSGPLRRVGVAAAAGVAAAGHPVGEGAGQGEADGGEAGGDLGGDGRGAGLLGRGGRHGVIVAAGFWHLGHCIKYKCCMPDAGNAEVAAYIGRWRPSSDRK